MNETDGICSFNLVHLHVGFFFLFFSFLSSQRLIQQKRSACSRRENPSLPAQGQDTAQLLRKIRKEISCTDYSHLPQLANPRVWKLPRIRQSTQWLLGLGILLAVSYLLVMNKHPICNWEINESFPSFSCYVLYFNCASSHWVIELYQRQIAYFKLQSLQGLHCESSLHGCIGQGIRTNHCSTCCKGFSCCSPHTWERRGTFSQGSLRGA